MTTICAWCQRVLKKDEPPLTYGLVSHGICCPCADQVKRELEISKLNAMWRAS